MDTRQFFQIGVKLIGLYYLIFALPMLLGLVLSILAIAGGSAGTSDMLGLPFLPALLGPVILFAVGIYILKDGALFQRLAHSASNGDLPERMADYFSLGVRLLGVYFILGSIPALSQTLSNYLFVVTTRYPTGTAVVQGLGMRSNFLPQLFLILFGFLLLVRVKLLTRWVFPPVRRNDSVDC